MTVSEFENYVNEVCKTFRQWLMMQRMNQYIQPSQMLFGYVHVTPEMKIVQCLLNALEKCTNVFEEQILTERLAECYQFVRTCDVEKRFLEEDFVTVPRMA